MSHVQILCSKEREELAGSAMARRPWYVSGEGRLAWLDHKAFGDRARDSLGTDDCDLLGFDEGLEIYSKCTQGSWRVQWGRYSFSVYIPPAAGGSLEQQQSYLQ